MSEQNTNKDMPFLQVQDLVVEYVSDGETVHAVNGVSITLEKGRTLAASLEAMPADPEEAMRYSHDTLLPAMAGARAAADALELLTAADRWPMPVYSQLLFSV